MANKFIPRISTILLIIPTIIFFTFLFSRTTPFEGNPLGPVDKTSVFKNVNWTNAIPPAKTAYVYTYLTGRDDDTNRYISTILGIEALKRTNTNRDIVVVVDRGVSKKQIESFQSHGAIVSPIHQEDIFSTHKPANGKSVAIGSYCSSNFGPLFAWTLTQYERVIWFDADILPQIIMDEFFLCGEFCLTFSNLQWYIASMIVLKPSRERFNQMMLELATPGELTIKLRGERLRWSGDNRTCQSLFEDFLIQSFYQVESAPLFNPELNGQETIPMMRLNMGSVMNPIYWYEKYTWDLARGPDYTAFKSNDVDKIPAHSVAFPSVKPYDWVQSIYWNMNWVWAHWRRTILNESYFNHGAVLLFLTTVFYIFSTTGLDFILKTAIENGTGGLQDQRLHRESTSFKIAAGILKVADVIGPSLVGSMIGFTMTIITLYFSMGFLPADMPYFVAWPLFAIILSAFQQITLHLTATTLFSCINGLRSWVESTSTVNKLNGSTPSEALGHSGVKVCTDEEWKFVNQLADKIAQDPSQIILFFLQPQTITIAPLAQAIFVQKIVDWRLMIINMLIIGVGYWVNQMNFYSHFALKIFSIFTLALVAISNFVKPYLSLVLVAYYADGARAWKNVKKE